MNFGESIEITLFSDSSRRHEPEEAANAFKLLPEWLKPCPFRRGFSRKLPSLAPIKNFGFIESPQALEATLPPPEVSRLGGLNQLYSNLKRDCEEVRQEGVEWA
jgi:hypothetical protein